MSMLDLEPGEEELSPMLYINLVNKNKKKKQICRSILQQKDNNYVKKLDIKSFHIILSCIQSLVAFCLQGINESDFGADILSMTLVSPGAVSTLSCASFSPLNKIPKICYT